MAVVSVVSDVAVASAVSEVVLFSSLALAAVLATGASSVEAVVVDVAAGVSAAVDVAVAALSTSAVCQWFAQHYPQQLVFQSGQLSLRQLLPVLR